MQVTTLNKIINLFLVGIFAIVVSGLIYYLINYPTQSDIEKLKKNVTDIGVPTIVLIGTLLLLSIGILLGIIVDSIVNLLFEKLLRKAIEFNFVRYILGCKKRYEAHLFLEKKFGEQFILVNKYKNLSEDGEFHRTYAVAIFFHTANKEHIEWAVQHYSLYLLSLNYLFIFCCIFVAAFFLPFMSYNKLWILTIILIFIYVLACQAVDKFLYSYEVAYRHSAVILSDEKALQDKVRKKPMLELV